MIVVSDTTPLNYLVLIEEQDLLRKLYSEIYIPQAVLAELTHQKTPELVKKWASNLPEWVIVKSPTNIISELDLDIGEQEAISLAKEIGATDILLDDMEAREVAASYGLSVTGTLGVLIFAARKNLVDIKLALEKLKNTNIRIKQELVDYVLKHLGEN